jgi:3-isopropylmalate dehydrogenase
VRAAITLLPGDGIGPEVVAEGARVLRTVAELGGHSFELREELVGGCAIEASGDPLPEPTLRSCRGSAAVLLGAVGGPRWDAPDAAVRPEQGLLRLRRELGVFANVRPVRCGTVSGEISPLRPERLAGVDLVIVRELTGGIYFGEKRREALDAGEERASDLCEYTTVEIERVVRVAAALASERRGRLTSVDKANVLETSRLWRAVATRVVRDEFPHLQLEHMLVDACAMHLIRDPAEFDVVVTENMFGDILSDEASMLAGSLGLLPSASLGARASGAAGDVGLYEPIHGSAPDIAGEGIANPLGTILSVAMLLRHSLGLASAAAAVEVAVEEVLAAGARTRDLAPPGAPFLSTTAMGIEVTHALERRLTHPTLTVQQQ